MKRGFTLIEVLIVVAVITILSAVVITAYRETQKSAADGAARSLVQIIHSGAEKYYSANNQYPFAGDLHGGTPTGSPPANNTAASQVLSVPMNTLDTAKTKLVACVPGVAGCNLDSLNKSRVYYFTKASQTSTTDETLSQTTTGGCIYTFPASETGPQSNLIMYWNSVEKIWKVIKSDKGGATNNNGYLCPFTAP